MSFVSPRNARLGYTWRTRDKVGEVSLIKDESLKPSQITYDVRNNAIGAKSPIGYVPPKTDIHGNRLKLDEALKKPGIVAVSGKVTKSDIQAKEGPKDPNAQIRHLYSNYVKWCEANQKPPMPLSAFKEHIAQK